MQFKTITITLFAAVAAAASNSSVTSLVDQLPKCASECLLEGAAAAGCAAADVACLCGNSTVETSFTTSAGVCLYESSSCPSDQVSEIKSIAEEICQAESTASASDLASASAAVTSVVGTAAAETSAAATGNAAVRPEMGFGVLVGMAAVAVLGL